MDRVRSVATRMGVAPPPVRIFGTFGALQAFAAIGSPLRPTLLLSDGILQRLAPEEVDAVIGHELGHGSMARSGSCRRSDQLGGAQRAAPWARCARVAQGRASRRLVHLAAAAAFAPSTGPTSRATCAAPARRVRDRRALDKAHTAFALPARLAARGARGLHPPAARGSRRCAGAPEPERAARRREPPRRASDAAAAGRALHQLHRTGAVRLARRRVVASAALLLLPGELPDRPGDARHAARCAGRRFPGSADAAPGGALLASPLGFGMSIRSA